MELEMEVGIITTFKRRTAAAMTITQAGANQILRQLWKSRSLRNNKEEEAGISLKYQMRLSPN